MKVGFLGPKGTFSYEVCSEYCKENYEKIEYKTIPETIIALNNNEIDECIVPIENSLQGCVTDAIDTLIQNDNIKVKKEVLLEIKQNLMSNKKYKLDEIKVVYSHPQALAQCKKYLSDNLPNVKQIAVESTAYSAQKVSQGEENCACICNISCLEEYDLKLIKESIQDNSFNKTKFWVLSKKENTEGHFEKMSMIFSVKDKPGALYNVLEIFSKYNLNLTKIESRPAKTILGEYYFLIDISIENGNEESAIKDIREKGIYVRVLGKY
jgi:prephenate dehydratase